MNGIVSRILHSPLILLAGVLLGSVLFFSLPPSLSSPLIAITGCSLLLLPAGEKFLRWPLSLSLQLWGAYLFADKVLYPFFSIWFLNRYFLSCVVFGGCLIFTAYVYDKSSPSVKAVKTFFISSFLVVGYSWLVLGGIQEINNNSPQIAAYSLFTLHLAAVAIVLTIIAEKLQWQNLAHFQAVYLPMLWASFVFALLTDGGPLLLYKGWIPWLVALFCVYRLLHFYDERWPKTIVRMYHLFSPLLVLAVITCDLYWLGTLLGKSFLYDICLASFLLVMTLVLRLTLSGENWPFGKYRTYYFLAGICVPAVLLGLRLATHLLDL